MLALRRAGEPSPARFHIPGCMDFALKLLLAYIESEVSFLDVCQNCGIPSIHSTQQTPIYLNPPTNSEDAVGTLKNRLQKGLDALGAAAYAVANMQTELEA